MTLHDRQYDVIVAGGGVAGSAAAAALSQLGYRIAIAEPGLDASRRLAGELVHNTGASALAEFGLLDSVQRAERTEVAGFAVRFGGAADSMLVRLPYSDSGTHAFAMEHGLMRDTLAAAVARLPGVTMLDRTRITAVDLSSRDRASVRVKTPRGESIFSTRLLIGADGTSSPVGRMAGIAQTRQRVSTLFGVLLHDQPLPAPGYGNVFLGGAGPVLAYAISQSAVRITFDIPDTAAGPANLADCRASLQALPEPFRREAGRALETSRVVASASYSAVVPEVTRGRMVLVGDAAGCCHPLTATGLTVCARDALRLRDALRDANGDCLRGLSLYARRRRAAQRTRLALARVLYDIFCGQTPESRLMRDGLRQYWNGSRKNSAKSMALLSTADNRLRVMMIELARVAVCSLGARITEAWREGHLSCHETRGVMGLPRLFLRHAGDALRTT